jgi:hypothetical protein
MLLIKLQELLKDAWAVSQDNCRVAVHEYISEKGRQIVRSTAVKNVLWAVSWMLWFQSSNQFSANTATLE